MQRDNVMKQMQTLFAKARAARKAGNGKGANTFRAGARRLRRKLAKLPKPAAKSEEPPATQAS